LFQQFRVCSIVFERDQYGKVLMVTFGVEHIEEEKAALLQTAKEVFLEAKGEGFDPVIMRYILKLRKMKKEEVMEQDHLLTLYRQAVGLEFES
jgi:uncharacterized protein (UPF0335 family)